MSDAPEHFVARDRARRLAWHLERVLQERKLAWRGEEIGMTSLVDEADLTLAEIAQDARESGAAVGDGLLTDRERPYMDVPFVVAMASVAWRVEAAAAAEADRRGRRRSEPEAAAVVAREIGASLERIAAFCAAYDAKRPLPVPRAVDLGRILERVGPPAEEGAGATPAPPTLLSDPHAVEDLLLALRAALPEAPGPWTLRPAQGSRPLALGLGTPDPADGPVEVPLAAERAASVLAELHPVEVRARGAASLTGRARLSALQVEMGDAVGRGLPAALEIAVGGEARLSSAGDAALRALLAAPPLPDGERPAPPPPARLVAVLGLLRVFDAEVPALVADRLGASRLRRAAAALPREPTRKAPLKKAFLSALEAEFPGLPSARLAALLDRVASGKVRPRDLGSAELAVALAVFGRTGVAGGVRLARDLDLAPLTDGEIETTVRDLLDLGRTRNELEAGRDLTPAHWTRLERALIGLLGRLGRAAP